MKVGEARVSGMYCEILRAHVMQSYFCGLHRESSVRDPNRFGAGIINSQDAFQMFTFSVIGVGRRDRIEIAIASPSLVRSLVFGFLGL